MKKQPISFSWPASLSDFSTDHAHENFSRAKLKVFYKGETADHRFFSDRFSEELITSLPYTPIVSHYDAEKDDFVGHATEQDIYGIVDPCRTPSFEKDEDGVEWCICDVVLYTERPDKVGDLAKKIVGHKQSLELDPSSVKYTINYDEKRHFKNVEFTAGRFVGVSVLGHDQKPAFTGSEFFNYDEKFEAKMQILRDYCESKDQEPGGNEMNLQEFMKLSYGDISVKVDEAICAEYHEEAFTQLVDMFADSAIVRFYSYLDGSSKLMRVAYSCDENGTITLGNVNEVHITYEDITTIAETGVEQATISEDVQMETEPEQMAKTDDEDICDDPDCPEHKDEDDEEFKADDNESSAPAPETDESQGECKDDEDEKSKCELDNCSVADAVPEAQVLDAEVTETDEQKVSVGNEQDEKEDSSATSFAESERAELEALKREKKINLLNSYVDYLTEEELKDFTSRIDEFDVETLEVELLRKYKTYNESSHSKPMRAFALNAPKSNSSATLLDDFVRRNLGR